MIVSPDRAAEAPASIWNTRLEPPPLTVTPAAGPLIVVVAVSVSSSWPPVRVIVCGVLNAVLSKAIVSAPGLELAWATAQRRLPGLVLSSVLLTVNVDGTQRLSSASTPRRARRGPWWIARVAGRMNVLRSQERIVMGNSRNRVESFPARRRKPKGRVMDDTGTGPRTVAATSARHSVGTTKEFSSNVSSSLIRSG